MTYLISEFFSEEKYDKIIYYLESQGVLALADLLEFDFNELLFIPGITEGIVAEVKEIIYEHYNEILSQNKTQSAGGGNTLLDSDYNENDSLSSDKERGNGKIIDVGQSELKNESCFFGCNIGNVGVKKLLEKGSTTVKQLKKVNNDFPSTDKPKEYMSNKNEVSLLSIPISNLPLSVRVKNCLMRFGIVSLEELLSFDEERLLKIRNIGTKAVEEILSVRDAVSFDHYNEILSQNKTQSIEKGNTLLGTDYNENDSLSSDKERGNGKIIDVDQGELKNESCLFGCEIGNLGVKKQLEKERTAVKQLKKLNNNSPSTDKLKEYMSSKNEASVLYIPISNLPLSERAKNCLMRAGIMSTEELFFLDEENLLKIRNLGTKTAKEIMSFRDTVAFNQHGLTNRSCFNNANDENKTLHIETTNHIYLHNINSENINLSISDLKNILIPERAVNLFLDNGCSIVGDLQDRELPPQAYQYVGKLEDFLYVPITQHFVNSFESLNDKAKYSLVIRSSGATLEEIGKELNITRERVRQILAKTTRKMRGIAELVAKLLLTINEDKFTFSELVDLFGSAEYATYCKMALQESEYVVYLKFSDSFFRRSICNEDIEKKLKRLLIDIIGNGLNFYDSLELIESELKKNNLEYFDIIDVMNFLVHIGYRFYGDYVAKGFPTSGGIFADVVKKYFKFDIKLDSKEENNDMAKLRQIIDKRYHGIQLPSNNRALTARMTHNSSNLVLSGLGRYCPIEKVIFSPSLLDEIREHVFNSTQNSFYYAELFYLFKGRLLAETNIDNPYFLHGVFKYLYPKDFLYERSLMSKNSEFRENIDVRLEKLLIENGNALRKSQIKKFIPGINDHVIDFAAIRVSGIIRWDFNEYNHIANLTISDDDVSVLSNLLEVETKLHSGYTGENLLYKAVVDSNKEFLEKNNILTPQNLFNVVSFIFKDKYRFRRPHIFSKDFPIQDVSTVSIAQFFLGHNTDLNYKEFLNLATDLGWAASTASSIFPELIIDFVRISEDEYVLKEHFVVTEGFLIKLAEILRSLVIETGYFAFNSIFDYEKFPFCSPYKWNGHLLESIIIEYKTGFRIISPQVYDRRYQRGIIVFDDSPLLTFEDLVVNSLLSEKIITLTEPQLMKHLRMRGIFTGNALPQELFECPQLSYKNGLFVVSPSKKSF
ncbi:MAG: DNA-directed RNA polymerase subunit alpha C-terminal domain-containing protein [Anaerovoracaceae bacterium]